MATDVSMQIPPPPAGYKLDGMPPPPPGYKLDNPDMGQTAQNTQPDQSSLISQIGSDIAKSEQNRQQIVNSQQQGDIGAIHSGFQQAGNAAGLVNNIAGNVIGSITPDFIKAPIEKAAQYVVNTAGSLPSLGGGTIGEKIPQELNTLEQNHPFAARDVQSALNLGALLSAKGIAGSEGAANAANATAQGIKTVSEKTGSALTQMAQDAAKAKAENTPLTWEQARQMAHPVYKAAEELGATLPADTKNEIATEINKLAPTPLGDATNPKSLESLVYKKSEGGGGAADQFRDDFVKEQLGTPLTFDSLTKIDKELNDRINGEILPNGKPTEQGKILMDMQDKFREIIDKAANADTEGTTAQALDLRRNANAIWAQSYKLNDLQKIEERAAASEVPATSARNGYKNLMLNQKKFSKYSPAEQAAIRQAARTGIGTAALKLVGSRLFDTMIGYAGGGIHGAIIGNVIGAGARELAGRMQSAPAKKLSVSMSKNIRNLANVKGE